MNDQTQSVPEVRDCTRCEGKGTTFHQGFTYGEKTYPDETKVCSRCKGAKTFTAPDYKVIFEMVTTGRGMADGKRKVRASADKKWNHYNDMNGARAYYVWRLARFHGGKDVTMPMMAGIAIGGDPFVAELDKLSELIAKRVFGTDMAGASRWGVLLGSVQPNQVPAGLPETAYEGGAEKL